MRSHRPLALCFAAVISFGRCTPGEFPVEARDRQPPRLPIPSLEQWGAKVPLEGELACESGVKSLGAWTTYSFASNAVVDPDGRLYLADNMHGIGTALRAFGPASGEAVWSSDGDAYALLWRAGRLIARSTAVLIASRDWQDGDPGRFIEIDAAARVVRQCNLPVPNVSGTLIARGRLYTFGKSIGSDWERYVNAFELPPAP